MLSVAVVLLLSMIVKSSSLTFSTSSLKVTSHIKLSAFVVSLVGLLRVIDDTVGLWVSVMVVVVIVVDVGVTLNTSL